MNYTTMVADDLVTHNQGIHNQDIGLVIQEYFSFNTLRFMLSGRSLLKSNDNALSPICLQSIICHNADHTR